MLYLGKRVEENLCGRYDILARWSKSIGRHRRSESGIPGESKGEEIESKGQVWNTLHGPVLKL